LTKSPDFRLIESPNQSMILKDSRGNSCEKNSSNKNNKSNKVLSDNILNAKIASNITAKNSSREQSPISKSKQMDNAQRSTKKVLLEEIEEEKIQNGDRMYQEFLRKKAEQEEHKKLEEEKKKAEQLKKLRIKKPLVSTSVIRTNSNSSLDSESSKQMISSKQKVNLRSSRFKTQINNTLQKEKEVVKGTVIVNGTVKGEFIDKSKLKQEMLSTKSVTFGNAQVLNEMVIDSD